MKIQTISVNSYKFKHTENRPECVCHT